MKTEGAVVLWRQGDCIALDGKVQSSPLQDLHSYRAEKECTASVQCGWHYIHELNVLFVFIAPPVNEAKQSSTDHSRFKCSKAVFIPKWKMLSNFRTLSQVRTSYCLQQRHEPFYCAFLSARSHASDCSCL